MLVRRLLLLLESAYQSVQLRQLDFMLLFLAKVRVGGRIQRVHQHGAEDDLVGDVLQAGVGREQVGHGSGVVGQVGLPFRPRRDPFSPVVWGESDDAGQRQGRGRGGLEAQADSKGS